MVEGSLAECTFDKDKTIQMNPAPDGMMAVQQMLAPEKVLAAWALLASLTLVFDDSNESANNANSDKSANNANGDESVNNANRN